jgi:hypothetical protein
LLPPKWIDNLPPDVRAVVRARWAEPYDEMLGYLAVTCPTALMWLVTAPGALSEPDLALAAEWVSVITDSRLARWALLPLLKHTSAAVRTGAIYGLARHIDDAAAEKLREVAAYDADADVRDAAFDTLDAP